MLTEQLTPHYLYPFHPLSHSFRSLTTSHRQHWSDVLGSTGNQTIASQLDELHLHADLLMSGLLLQRHAGNAKVLQAGTKW